MVTTVCALLVQVLALPPLLNVIVLHNALL